MMYIDSVTYLQDDILCKTQLWNAWVYKDNAIDETEVTEETDKQVEAMIKEADAQCKASEFGKATDTVVQARTLLTKE